MRLLLTFVAAASALSPLLLAQAPPARAVPGSAAARLVGTWSLARYEAQDGDTAKYRGQRPIGVLYYDAAGHMAVQISPDRSRRRFTGPMSGVFGGPQPSLEEAFDALAGYAAYFGTYVVDEAMRTVTHTRVGNLNPGALGDFVRRFDFPTPDRLVLTPLERSGAFAVRLTWDRAR